MRSLAKALAARVVGGKTVTRAYYTWYYEE